MRGLALDHYLVRVVFVRSAFVGDGQEALIDDSSYVGREGVQQVHEGSLSLRRQRAGIARVTWRRRLRVACTSSARD
jgi:hypothetical protein